MRRLGLVTPRRRGFTLTAMLVALFILALCVVPMVGLMRGGARVSAGAAQRLRAVRTMMDVLDYYAAFPELARSSVFDGCSDLLAQTDVAFPLAGLSAQEREALQTMKARLFLTFVDAVPSHEPMPGLFALDATMTWQEAGATRTFTARQLLKVP